MGIALKCNVSFKVRDVASIPVERRRRCWLGILSLYTYQGILFRDVNLRSLMAASEVDFIADSYLSAHSSPGTRIMGFKTRLFRLCSHICHKLSDNAVLNEEDIAALDAEISNEQAIWDAAFLDGGSPSILDTASYAHWCMLQVYAHHFYLLLHRPFCRARASDGTGTARYRQSSRRKCIVSGAALLDLQRRYVELPRLRHHRWSVYGMIGSCAVHGAMALASCLLEEHDDGLDVEPCRRSFDAAVDRMGMMQRNTTIYAKAYPILRHIQ